MVNFSSLVAALPKVINAQLPGEVAHNIMSPPERRVLLSKLNIQELNPQKASVLMLVYPVCGIATLSLIKRNSYQGVHSAQISLPGGKIEGRESHLAAALREAEEEIGIDAHQIQIIRSFSEVYIPPSNFLVTPFLGICYVQPLFRLNSREVAELIELPLNQVINEENVKKVTMNTSYSQDVEVPAFVINNQVIWGATAMIISELKQVLNALK